MISHYGDRARGADVASGLIVFTYTSYEYKQQIDREVIIELNDGFGDAGLGGRGGLCPDLNIFDLDWHEDGF